MPKIVKTSELADDAVLLDVREQDEWDAGHAPGAVHIPLGEVPQRLGELPEGEPLPVICRSGNRSGRAADWLEQQGFEVANVEGGMKQWAFEGKPVVGADGTEGQVI
ncbi:rhodanese-like domain-containing protein [Calidifontibacter sp. DB0510]|uniref:Rhodanese-like domain-containing protein n=1 Tax=Metallococcus carri TaxID=1656884 RepID=A0A967B0X6_9MICO|nr:rhodanese-like domain-containing protein [Metallococcus carri]NHN56273.1 rhodanese-like domain-containing protein [Metallococcus carri]NOP38675.1 rhodanese-like domain-containing protein [Calidifontibacter sp. DB2511S]